MPNKLRAMGITWDPKETYKGNVVIAALERSYQDGIEKGKRDVAAECERENDRAYKLGYQRGLSDGSSDLVELAKLLKKILRQTESSFD